jgi:hypothetical protein
VDVLDADLTTLGYLEVLLNESSEVILLLAIPLADTCIGSMTFFPLSATYRRMSMTMKGRFQRSNFVQIGIHLEFVGAGVRRRTWNQTPLP